MLCQVTYEVVTRTMSGMGLIELYPNSGAFGFPPRLVAGSVGWAIGDDSTIRPTAQRLVRRVAPPVTTTLAALAVGAWTTHLPGPLWLLPKAHWAYELQFGNSEWMPAALAAAGANSADLETRHDGAALAFDPREAPSCQTLLNQFLTHLQGSDFLLAWPPHPIVCTLHHHKQLWWTTPDPGLLDALHRMVPGDQASGEGNAE